jgi:hypothetical protein
VGLAGPTSFALLVTLQSIGVRAVFWLFCNEVGLESLITIVTCVDRLFVLETRFTQYTTRDLVSWLDTLVCLVTFGARQHRDCVCEHSLVFASVSSGIPCRDRPSLGALLHRTEARLLGFLLSGSLRRLLRGALSAVKTVGSLR